MLSVAGMSAAAAGAGGGGDCRLVPDPDEVFAELFRHRGRLLRDDGVLVHADDQGLGGFYAVDPAGALLGAYDLVRRGEVHVLHAGHRQPTLRQLIRAAVLGQQGLQLVHGNREARGLRPDVAVVAADDGVLDHLGGHQLVVDVRLPRHIDYLRGGESPERPKEFQKSQGDVAMIRKEALE